jgi:hypothetical protein
MAESATPAYIASLIRHFADLRDGTHGGPASRKDEIRKLPSSKADCKSLSAKPCRSTTFFQK